jgi:hypothetical protein
VCLPFIGVPSNQTASINNEFGRLAGYKSFDLSDSESEQLTYSEKRSDRLMSNDQTLDI